MAALFLCLTAQALLTDETTRRGNGRRARVRTFDEYAATLSDREWRKRFRITQPRFFTLLELIRPDLQKDAQQASRSSGSGVSPEWRLAIALRMYAGADTNGASDMAHVADTSVWPITHEVTAAIKKRCKLPGLDYTNAEQLRRLAEGFASKANTLPGCVAALDGCGVRIKRPEAHETDHKSSTY